MLIQRLIHMECRAAEQQEGQAAWLVHQAQYMPCGKPSLSTAYGLLTKVAERHPFVLPQTTYTLLVNRDAVSVVYGPRQGQPVAPQQGAGHGLHDSSHPGPQAHARRELQVPRIECKGVTLMGKGKRWKFELEQPGVFATSPPDIAS